MTRPRRIHTLFVIGLLAASAGCTAERHRPANQAGLAGTSWLLVYLGTDAALTATEVTLAFPDDSSFAGGSGCNRYFGRYQHDVDGSISLGETGNTMMMCPPPQMEQEGRYLGALGRVTGYRLQDGRLELVEDSVPALTFVLTDEISTPN